MTDYSYKHDYHPGFFDYIAIKLGGGNQTMKNISRLNPVFPSEVVAGMTPGKAKFDGHGFPSDDVAGRTQEERRWCLWPPISSRFLRQ